MSPFNLADYEPVEERLARFWQDHPHGRVSTEIVNGSHAGESVIMKASIWKGPRDFPQAVVYEKKDGGEHVMPIPQPYRDAEPDAVGHAQETPGSNPVNKTSWVENCETSAIGRALANMGYAPKGARPSREEMVKVAAPRPEPPSAGRRSSTTSQALAKPKKKLRAAQIRLLDTAKDADISEDLRHRIVRRLTEGATQSIKDLDDDACDKITAQIKVFGAYRDAGMKNLEEWESRND